MPQRVVENEITMYSNLIIRLEGCMGDVRPAGASFRGTPCVRSPPPILVRLSPIDRRITVLIGLWRTGSGVVAFSCIHYRQCGRQCRHTEVFPLNGPILNPEFQANHCGVPSWLLDTVGEQPTQGA